MEVVNGVSDGGPPPPSPLTGCYLLIVIGEPHSPEHKDIILRRVAKGLLSWDVNDCMVDLEKELAIINEQAPEGEEARYGERLIQYASENLVTEILIHPAVSTLSQCVRNLLSSFTRHRHIIHSGYTFASNGSWALQDGTFSLADFSEAFQEVEVQRVIRAYDNGISVDIHCSPEGDWPRLPKETFAKNCKVRLNPVDVMPSSSPAIADFLNYITPFLVPLDIVTALESSEVVGNIRFSHPTLYVFPGGQGDAALFGINGFNMLLDGGFSRKACFWDFVRHLDRLDAVLLTRLNNSNVSGITSVLKRKRQNGVYPQIGHFFCNIQERKALLSPDGDKDKDPLLINLLEEGHNIVTNLKHLSLHPQSCYRDSDPINLYHKVGHGTLDMYVLSPAKDSREVREFIQKWNNQDNRLFANPKTKDFSFPLPNLVSICALLVWQPSNSAENITRILFPGSTPQSKIFEGLDRLKQLDCIKYPVCSENSLNPPKKTKEQILDSSKMAQKILPDVKKEKSPRLNDPKPKLQDNKTSDMPEPKKEIKKSDSTDSDKSTKANKPKDNKEIKEAIAKTPRGRDKDSKSVERKKVEKKPSPTTPKKALANGDAPKPKAAKVSPTATPAKSAKEATNRKVLESKKQTPKKDAKSEKKEPEKKVERKPISRRPKPQAPPPAAKGSPIRKKPDSIAKKAKLDKEGTTDSSTVSTPTADADVKRDISKLTPEEIDQLKAQELADLQEEQEVVQEIEAVFRKGEEREASESEMRKIKNISIEEKTDEEYLIVEKVEVQEDEIQKITRDSEESEKQRKLSEPKIEEVAKEVVSPEEKVDKVESATQPDEKFSATVESGATTAPTLPEDERIPLDEIKEKDDTQIIEEKHVKEDTKEKEAIPVIQLPSKSIDMTPPVKVPPVVGIRLDKQQHIRDIVKTPDEVADLPVHEVADHYAEYQKATDEQKETKTEVEKVKDEVKAVVDDIIEESKDIVDKAKEHIKEEEDKGEDEVEETKKAVEETISEVQKTEDEIRDELGEQIIKLEHEGKEDEQVEETKEEIIEETKDLLQETTDAIDKVEDDMEEMKENVEEQVCHIKQTAVDLSQDITKEETVKEVVDQIESVIDEAEEQIVEKVDEVKECLEITSEKVDEATEIVKETKQEIEEKIESKVEEKIETKIEEKIEEKIETKIEEKIETKVEEKIETKIEEIKSTIEETKETITELKESVTEKIAETTEKLEKKILEDLQTAKETISNVEQSTEQIKSTIVDEAEANINSVKESITETIATAESTKEVNQESITDIKDTIVSEISEEVSQTKESFVSEVKETLDAVTEKSEGITGFFSKTFAKLEETTKAIGDKLTEEVEKVIGDTKSEEGTSKNIETCIIVENVDAEHPEVINVKESPETHSPSPFDFIDKTDLGRKSPKEREQDVAKIVASVAEVLKSEAPLEDFKGKIPLEITTFPTFTPYTTELRETHITTVDSPIAELPGQITPIREEKIDEVLKAMEDDFDANSNKNKISDLIKDSDELLEASSKMISGIKERKDEEKDKIEEEQEEGEPIDTGTVHRMLVTASSEDGGEETVICPPGSITFSKSAEGSERNSPELKKEHEFKVQDTPSPESSQEQPSVLQKEPEISAKMLSEDIPEKKDKVDDDVKKPELPVEYQDNKEFEEKDSEKEKEIEKEQLGMAEDAKSSPEEVAMSGKATPEPTAELSGKTSPEQVASGKVTPEVEKVTASSGKATPEPVAVSGKATPEPPVKSGKATPEPSSVPEKATLASGKATPEPAVLSEKATPEPALSGKATPEPTAFSGKATPEPSVLTEKATSELTTLSGKATPEPVALSGKATPEPPVLSGKHTPEPTTVSGKATPEPTALSGKATPESSKVSEKATPEPTALSGKATPEPTTLSGKATPEPPVLSGKATPEPPALSGKATSEPSTQTVAVSSGKATPEISDKAKSGKTTPDLSKSGKSTPDIPEAQLPKDTSGKSTPDLKDKDSKPPTGKTTPEPVAQISKSTSPSGKSTPEQKDDHHKILSGKATPDLKDKPTSGKSTPDSKDKPPSGKSTPDLKDKPTSGKISPEPKEKSGKSSPELEMNGKISPETGISIDSGKVSPETGMFSSETVEEVMKTEETTSVATSVTHTEERKESITSSTTTFVSQDKPESGKASPEVPKSGKESPVTCCRRSDDNEDKQPITQYTAEDMMDGLGSGASSPELNNISGKSTPDFERPSKSPILLPAQIPKSPLLSGKATPDISKSGKATPEIPISGKATPDIPISGKATPEISKSGKETPDLSKSGKATPEVSKSGKETPEISKSGISSPDFGKGDSIKLDTDSLASGKATPDVNVDLPSSIAPQMDTDSLASGKMTPDLKHDLSSGKQTPELDKHSTQIETDSLASGKITPDLHKLDASGKTTPSGKSTPDKKSSIQLDDKIELSGKTTPLEKSQELLVDEPSLSGKSTPDIQHKIDETTKREKTPSGKTTPDLHQDELSSKKSSVQMEEEKSSRKSSVQIDEDKQLKETVTSVKKIEESQIVSGKSTPDLKLSEGRKESLKEQEISTSSKGSVHLSGKTSPEAVNGNLHSGQTTPDHHELLDGKEFLQKGKEIVLDSEKTTEVLKKVEEKEIKSDLDISRDSIVSSGKSTPDIKKDIEKVSLTSGKSTPDVGKLETMTIEESTPDVKEEKQDVSKPESVQMLSGKSTPVSPDHQNGLSRDSIPSGKSTPGLSGKVTPEPDVSSGKITPVLSGKATPEIPSGKATPGLSGKDTPEPPSGKATPDSKILSPEPIGKAELEKSISGKATPTTDVILSGKVTPDIKDEEKLSGKSTPDSGFIATSSMTTITSSIQSSNTVETLKQEIKSHSGSQSPDFSKRSSIQAEHILSGKSTPDSGKVPIEEHHSGKSTPDFGKRSSMQAEHILSGKSTPDLGASSTKPGKISPDIHLSEVQGKTITEASEVVVTSSFDVSQLQSAHVFRELMEETIVSSLDEKTSLNGDVIHEKHDTTKLETVKESLSGKSTPEIPKDSRKSSVLSAGDESDDRKFSITSENTKTSSVISGKSTPDVKDEAKHTIQAFIDAEREVQSHTPSPSKSGVVPQVLDPMATSFYGALPDDDDEDDHNQGTTSDLMTSSFIGELPTHEASSDKAEEVVKSWGKPLGLPSPAPPADNKGTPKKEKRLPANVSVKNKLNQRSESPSKKKKINPIYVDLTYVPHHGNSYYTQVEFFKRVRARYYVFSGIEPSREVYNALLEAKQTWEDKDLEVTIIPTYDTDVLGYWVAENEELLTKFKIDLSPSASRCTINLQDHETSCSAYRLEF